MGKREVGPDFLEICIESNSHYVADSSGRAVYCVGLRPLACWDCGFESRRGHECECCLLLGRGVCDELITRPEESYRLWCVVVCDLETS